MSLLLLFGSGGGGGGPVDHAAAVSFAASATLSPTGVANFTASVAFAPTATLAPDARTVVSWPSVRFSARALFVPTIRPRGKKRRTVIVDSTGAPFGELENARQGAITKELNRPDSWTLALGLTDPKAPLVLEERIREAQLWRGDRLLSWGPMIRPGADKANVAVAGADAMWYFGRRNIGRAGRTSYVPNGDFEDGLAGWDIGFSSPAETAAGRNPANWIAEIRTDRALTGRRSLYLEQIASPLPEFGFAAKQFFDWTVDPEASPDGDRWTIVAYAFVVDSEWRGPRADSIGLYLARESTTVFDTVTSADGIVTSVPRLIESTSAPIDEYTPRDQWVRLEASLTMEPTGDTEQLHVAIGCPDGAVYFDRVSLVLEESSKFYATDQALIVKALVEHAQDVGFDKSDLNIGTDCPLTGVLRDRVYVHSEHPNIFDAMSEFAELDNGLDLSVAVTPTERTLRTHYPARGVYRPKCRLELGKEIADFAWSFDGEAAANSIIVLGQGSGSGREEGYAIDPTAFAGDLTLEAVFSAAPDTPIDSLDNLAAEFAVAASDPEILAVKTIPNLERVIGVLEPGDWIPVRISAGRGALTIAADYRVSRITLNPDDTLDLVLNLRELPT